MFAQVLHFNRAEGAKAGMQRDLCKPDTFYFEALDQLTAEMQAGGRSGYSAFMFSVNGLITFFIFLVWLALDVFW